MSDHTQQWSATGNYWFSAWHKLETGIFPFKDEITAALPTTGIIQSTIYPKLSTNWPICKIFAIWFQSGAVDTTRLCFTGYQLTILGSCPWKSPKLASHFEGIILNQLIRNRLSASPLFYSEILFRDKSNDSDLKDLLIGSPLVLIKRLSNHDYFNYCRCSFKRHVLAFSYFFPAREYSSFLGDILFSHAHIATMSGRKVKLFLIAFC